MSPSNDMTWLDWLMAALTAMLLLTLQVLA